MKYTYTLGKYISYLMAKIVMSSVEGGKDSEIFVSYYCMIW